MIETAWFEGLFMTVSLMNLDNRTSELLMQISTFEVFVYVVLYSMECHLILQSSTIFPVGSFSDQAQCPIHCKRWEHTSIDHRRLRATKSQQENKRLDC